jgi:small-conductance mechanosensitive channel
MAFTVLYRLLDAVIVIFVGLILARVAGRLARGALHEFDVANLARKVGMRVPLEQPVGIAVEVFIAACVIAFALFRLGVLRQVVFAVLGVLGAALVLTVVPAVRDAVPNLLAALAVPRERLRPGMKVRVGDISGTVTRKGLMDIEVARPGGERLDIPYAYLKKMGVQ